MRTILHHLFLLFFLLTLSKFNFAQVPWVQKADVPLGGSVVAYFAIGNKAYLLKAPFEFWEWNSDNNSWSRKTDFPGTQRGGATGFSIGTKGYISGGQIYGGFFTDLWEWDQATDTWTRKADKGGNGRENPSSFVIGNKAYLVGGWNLNNTNIPELWEWDQATNTWLQKATCPCGQKAAGVALSIGNKGYFGTGWTNTSNVTNDFWEWDQATDTWQQKANVGGPPRSSAVGFSIGNKAYIGTGTINSNSQTTNDLWEWDQATNSWSEKASIPGIERHSAIGYSINGKGYIGNGTHYDPNTGGSTELADFWEFNPLIFIGINETTLVTNFKYYPNPSIKNLTVSLHTLSTQQIILKISNSIGKVVYEDHLKHYSGEYINTIDLGEQAMGIYTLEISSDKERILKKVILQ
ncbi:MAG: type sorting protein [Bacteroidetes bacterium]|jgi:hypothetical protein|nr:type sorting protein [Bacteroidota bacterium]